jgi:hypothetical protein
MMDGILEILKISNYNLNNFLNYNLKMKLRVSYNREVLLVLTYKKLYEKYGSYFIDYYFRPSITEYGVPRFIYNDPKKINPEIEETFEQLRKALIDPPIPTASQKRIYDSLIESALRPRNSLGSGIKLPETLHEKYALARYQIFNVVFGGLGWSVLPEYKKRWNIDQELFGNYINTNGKFCSIFPELEGRDGVFCQFGTFEPKSDMHYLVNPPFQTQYIIWTCTRLMNWLNDSSDKSPKNVKFTVIIPVWDEESRKKLKLKSYGPLKELTTLLKSKYVTFHSMSQMKFWDAVHKKVQHQKAYIHKIVLEKLTI